MRLVRPFVEFLNMTKYPLETIERAGRTCYKSEAKIVGGSSLKFVQKLLDRGHLAMIEHAYASYRVTCDRGVTHEIVRHRLFSYAQESTRYCNYKGGVTFIIPPWFPEKFKEGEYFYTDANSYNGDWEVRKWLSTLFACEVNYINLLSKWSPQQARGVLPNALKTELVMTGNLREWLYFLTLRTAESAHPQMREVADMLLQDMRKRVHIIFDDLGKESEHCSL